MMLLLYNRFTIYTRLMLRHNFCRPNGRLVKLVLFSTVPDKSPLTSIHFTTFEKKSQVSPTRTTKLFGFWYYTIHYIVELEAINRALASYICAVLYITRGSIKAANNFC